ncbi:MAG: PAS domain S-box protein [Melioribacter sp.]|nr:PAS domain S-box protein [Melioribacter sp.]
MEKDFFKIFVQTSAELANSHSKDELIISFLNCFSTVSGCKSVSLYLVDQNSFEINLAGIFDESSKEEGENIFLELVENEVIAELLNNPDGTVNYKTRDYQIRILPINRAETVIGFFVFVFNLRHEYLPEIDFLLNHYCNLFSLQLINFTYNETQPASLKKIIESANTNINILTQQQYNLLDYLKEGILFVEKKTGKIVDANEPAINILKIKKGNIIGTDKSRYFSFLDKNLFKDEIIAEDETLLIASDGTVFPVLFSTRIFKINDSDYEIISFLDISERKSMEDLILQSRFHLEQLVEERTKELSISNKELKNQIQERIKKEEENLVLYLAIQQSPAYVILTDLYGNIEFVNNALIKQTGYNFDEVVKQNPRIFKSGDLETETYKQLWENIISGESWKGEFRNRKKNGELYWVSSQISPIIDSNGKIIKYLAIQADITQRKKYEEELINSKVKIEKAYHFKDALLANMSHEFRTPLISIIGCSDLLLEELNEGELIELARAIQQGGSRLLKTLNNVLLLSDLESGNYDSELTPRNIIPIVKTQTDNYGYIAESKNIMIITRFEETELILEINEFFFNTALENLIDNAVKYTQEGSIIVAVKKDFTNEDTYGVITIQDSGIGINEEEKQIVFDAFRQAEEGHKRNFEGTGLGLTIAQKAISNMKGFIKLEDNYPTGAKFSIYLPLGNNLTDN